MNKENKLDKFQVIDGGKAPVLQPGVKDPFVNWLALMQEGTDFFTQARDSQSPVVLRYTLIRRMADGKLAFLSDLTSGGWFDTEQFSRMMKLVYKIEE